MGEKNYASLDMIDEQITDESINSMYHDWEIEIDVMDNIKLHKKKFPPTGAGLKVLLQYVP